MRESLDMATAAAAFDLPVQILLRGDAVYGALASQSSDGLRQKDIGKQLGALGIYGVSDIFIESAALDARCLGHNDLLAGIRVLDPAGVKALLRRAGLTVQL